jgi:hypothetical protein
MRKYFAAISLGALVVAVSAASCKCQKDDDIPPMPSAAPPASTPAPVVELTVEDAGEEAGDADAAKKATGTYTPAGLMACCNALAQNAKSAPPAQAPMMLQAAAVCKAAAATGNSGGVNAALAQFKMSCK